MALNQADAFRGPRSIQFFYTAIWLVFLGYPISGLLSRPRPGWEYAFVLSCLALFVVLYLWAFLRRSHAVTVAAVAVTLGLSVSLTAWQGADYLGLFVYSGALIGNFQNRRLFISLAVLNLGLMVLISWLAHLDELNVLPLFVITFGTTVGVQGISSLLRYARDLREARDEVARLARAEERERIARDLHDLLGHTLSLVVLKSELAERLVERDPSGAANEIRDLQEIARAALGEVREAVTGYLPHSLESELSHARRALRAANIAAELPTTAPTISPEQDAALALVVREAVTNVIRHSGASSCSIAIQPDADEICLTVVDDGRATGKGILPGNGLHGMRHRVEDLGGVLRWSTEAGMHITARLPLAHAQ